MTRDEQLQLVMDNYAAYRRACASFLTVLSAAGMERQRQAGVRGTLSRLVLR